jgi:glycosyltransferase involved in cell wall biosynthesis
MKNELFLSIIIPSYNSQQTIGKCLDSIFSSDYPKNKYEVVVVDDCSTDNSANIVKTYPCKLIKLNKNSGPATARNSGAKKSRGDILVFIDSDVVIEKNTFNLTASSFNKESACLTAINTKKSDYNFSTDFLNLLDYFIFLKSPRYVILPCTSYCAIKKNIFEDLGGFNENYKKSHVEDLELGIRLVNKGYKIYLNKKLKFTHLKKYTFLNFLKHGFFRSFYRIKILLNGKYTKTTSSYYPLNILFLLFLLVFVSLGFLLSKVFFLLCLIPLILFFVYNL